MDKLITLNSNNMLQGLIIPVTVMDSELRNIWNGNPVRVIVFQYSDQIIKSGNGIQLNIQHCIRSPVW